MGQWFWGGQARFQQCFGGCDVKSNDTFAAVSHGADQHHGEQEKLPDGTVEDRHDDQKTAFENGGERHVVTAGSFFIS